MKLGNQTFVCACGCYALDMLQTRYAVKCRQCGRVFGESTIFNARRVETLRKQNLREELYVPAPTPSRAEATLMRWREEWANR